MLGIVSLSEKLNCEMDFSLLEKLKSLDGMRNRYYEDLGELPNVINYDLYAKFIYKMFFILLIICDF